MKLSPEEKKLIKNALNNTIGIYLTMRKYLNKEEIEKFKKYKTLQYRFENNGERPKPYEIYSW